MYVFPTLQTTKYTKTWVVPRKLPILLPLPHRTRDSTRRRPHQPRPPRCRPHRHNQTITQTQPHQLPLHPPLPPHTLPRPKALRLLHPLLPPQPRLHSPILLPPHNPTIGLRLLHQQIHPPLIPTLLLLHHPRPPQLPPLRPPAPARPHHRLQLHLHYNRLLHFRLHFEHARQIYRHLPRNRCLHLQLGCALRLHAK